MSRNNGFTLIELLIAISIIMSVLSIGIASFTVFNRRERIRQAALTLKSNLRLAQTRAISSQKPSSGCTTYFGIRVSFTADSYAIEHVCDPEGVIATADCTPPSIRDCVLLSPGLEFAPVPSDFVFQTQSQRVDITQDETVTLTNSIESYGLTVSPNGNINDEGYQ